MHTDNPWTVKNSKIVYKNPWMQVREDAVLTPEGADGIYGVIESNDSVMIVAVNNENHVYLINSFSYPVASWSWELPGGGGDGEDPVTAAQRELAEETGIRAHRWTALSTTRVCNGLMTEKMTTVLAQDLTFGEKLVADDTALIRESQFVSFDAAHAMIEAGEIDDGQTITALYLAEKWLAKNA